MKYLRLRCIIIIIIHLNCNKTLTGQVFSYIKNNTKSSFYIMGTEFNTPHKVPFFNEKGDSVKMNISRPEIIKVFENKSDDYNLVYVSKGDNIGIENIKDTLIIDANDNIQDVNKILNAVNKIDNLNLLDRVKLQQSSQRYIAYLRLTLEKQYELLNSFLINSLNVNFFKDFKSIITFNNWGERIGLLIRDKTLVADKELKYCIANIATYNPKEYNINVATFEWLVTQIIYYTYTYEKEKHVEPTIEFITFINSKLNKGELLDNTLLAYVNYFLDKNQLIDTNLQKQIIISISNGLIKEKLISTFLFYNNLNQSEKNYYSALLKRNISLNELINSKNKLIYIDFWASWCVPCISEFNKFEVLKNKYPQIRFIKISVDEKYTDWLKAIEQLNSDDESYLMTSKNKKQQFYNITIDLLPKFVLVYNGAILNSNAPRPSNIDIDSFLISNLNKIRINN